MFGIEQRETKSQRDPQTDGTTPFVDEQNARSDPEGEQKRRHAVLMECLHDERDRQAEERLQAAIDEDVYDHLHWRREDAAVLMDRGQAPLVYPESRQTIDWISGMQKRMRKDYKILPRERGDEQGAEVKSQVVKYTDDVNLTQWHRSRAFKQAALSGLGWLEEGINLEPGEEIIYSGSEDWRNVYRDSRAKQFDLKDGRYLFRRKVTDLDYAMALLPKAKDHLRNIASTDEVIDDDDVWFLGERLTNASDLDHMDGLPARWRDRRAFIGNDYTDKGRRSSVELLECWYRVPERVQAFNDGPLAGKIFNPADPAHLQIQQDRWSMYDAVKLRMRVMIATKDQPLWDGASPFRHGQFLLIPIWGYRRYRDGLCYGVMRGMRDLQEDTNKRASKAQWLLANNRMVMDSGAVDDIEEARDEAARPDGVIVKKIGKELRFEKPVGEIQGNLEMMDRNIAAMRNAGGVTNENLGRDTNSKSGVAIERKQDQGSLTTSELFDNLRLAVLIAGKLRLSHIEQFWTQQKAIRITGEAQPIEWLEVNKTDPDTGEVMNDLTAREADFYVGEQDYRESYIRAAMEQTFQLLGQIATFAPQVVLAVLDLAVDSAELPNKDEWVSRIRKLNGQRDPTKAPTPEEEAQAQIDGEKKALQEQLAVEMAQAQLAKEQANAAKLDVEAMAKRVDVLTQALTAAQLAATNPALAPVADEMAAAAGFKPQGGTDPNIPQPAAAPTPMDSAAPIDPTQQPAGPEAGIPPQEFQ
jgi:hypothetical protein